jgi:hypothetical protein
MQVVNSGFLWEQIYTKMTYMYHHVAKGVDQDGGSNNIMTWWKTNFNMPVPNLWDGSWGEGRGPFTYNGEGTSFDLSGFYPGYEVVAFFCGWHWDGPVSGTAYLYSQWRDENNNLMFTCANGLAVGLNIQQDYWYEYMYACNQGVAGWEIDVAGNYRVRSWSTGAGAMSQQDTIISFSNVPSTTQLSSTKIGYIWVEGNNLCFINANRWKHSMAGDNQGYVDTNKKGYMWIDNDNYLHWIGNDGNNYRVRWRIQQFASTWSNGPTGPTYAGTDKKGYTWVDSEFGDTHIAYIGANGYKFLMGAGEYPYQAP